MKKNIHPTNYRPVIFYDNTAKTGWLISSCAQTSKTMVWEEDKKEYPVFYLDTSAASHPFYTGNKRTTATEGRIKKFNDKFSKFSATKVKE